MRIFIGIGITVFLCFAALDFWGRTVQILAVVCLGLACIIADLKASEKS